FTGDGTVECIPQEVNQLLSSVIQNALEAAPEGDGHGLVRVHGTSLGDAVIIAVSDNGPGIKKEDQAKLFTPFFNTNETGQGMGLGLTTARRVAQHVGGTISVDSQIGQGTTFTIRLPVAQGRASIVGAGAGQASG